jgi:small subunit ribosomal protein S16
MLIMRFNRTGKKNRVSYRVVLQEHTAAPGKRHIEILGSHDPHTKTTVLREDRIKHWIAEGVQTSDAVHNLLVRKGILTADKKAKKMPRPVTPEPAEEPEVKEPAKETESAESEPAAPEEVAEVTEEKVEAPEEAVAETKEPEPTEAKATAE